MLTTICKIWTRRALIVYLKILGMRFYTRFSIYPTFLRVRIFFLHLVSTSRKLNIEKCDDPRRSWLLRRQWGTTDLGKYSTDSSQHCGSSTSPLIATNSVAFGFMCGRAGWSPTRHATPFGENWENSMCRFFARYAPSLLAHTASGTTWTFTRFFTLSPILTR